MGWHLIVIHDPDDPDPSRRFKMMLMTRWEKSSTSVPLFSGDGWYWRMGGEGKISGGIVPTASLVLPPEFFEQGGSTSGRGCTI